MSPVPSNVIPLIQGAAHKIDRMERHELVQVYEQYRNASNEWLRKQIVENDRIDILAGAILGFDVKPFHLAIMQWQFQHKDSLILAFRGAGKSTIGVTSKAIHYLCKDRNYTILIGSESKLASTGILREIKSHLENNERLIEVFGKFYDPRLVAKWDTVEIDVVGKTRRCKESTITCTGVDSAITSRHFDILLTDDLVTQDNSETTHMRDKARVWYYKTYTPLLHPPDAKRPHVGEHHRMGVRYHFDDLYGHLMEHELKDRTLVIRALNEDEQSPDPERFPPDFFKEKRSTMGLIIFNCHSEDTEFLTDSGWKIASEITSKQRLATFNQKKWVLEFQRPLSRLIKRYRGSMLHLKSRSVDALVTVDHRFLTRALRGGDERQDTWKFVTANKLDKAKSTRTGRVQFPATTIWRGKRREYLCIKDSPRCYSNRKLPKTVHVGDLKLKIRPFVRFLGYFVSEGHTTFPVRGTVTFSQKEGAIADDMIETIRQLGIEPWVNRNHSPYVHFGFAHMGFWSWLRRNCGTCSKEKKVPRIVFCLPSIEIEEFLDTLVSGDGSRNPAGSEGSFWYSTISKQLNDDLHDLCLRVGIVLSSRCDTFSNPMWNPSYDSYGHYAEVLTYLPERTQEVDYDGKIVCFSVPNETLITRRNGRVLISGNSQYQCDTEAMKGEVFAYDDCQQIGEADFPKDAELRLYMGVDLAAQAEERHSMFSISVIGLLGSILKDDYRVYLVDFYLDHLKATKQPEKVLEFYDRWTPLRVGIETVQYQELLADLVRELRPGMVVEKIPTSQDKLLRAWKIAPLFENKRVFFKRAVQMRAIDHLVRFPDGRFTGDMFDSLDHALRAAKRGIRRPRRERPSFGLL